MGSVFLYLAIVLMWLCVLVPMWLRRDRTDEDELVPAFAQDVEDAASDLGLDAADDGGTGDTLSEAASGAVPGDSAAPADDTPLPAASPAIPPGEDGDTSGVTPPTPSMPPTPPAPLMPSRADRRRAAARRRARLIARRRRRMLWSILLVIASAITAATGVVSWWGVLPSAFLLLGYLVMLRTAVRVDAEHRAHAARARAERARRRRARQEALALAAQQTAAEILEFDASRRVELFDQYADPPRRAVGD